MNEAQGGHDGGVAGTMSARTVVALLNGYAFAAGITTGKRSQAFTAAIGAAQCKNKLPESRFLTGRP